LPVYKCPKCGRQVELPEGKYYCKICGPAYAMETVRKTEISTGVQGEAEAPEWRQVPPPPELLGWLNEGYTYIMRSIEALKTNLDYYVGTRIKEKKSPREIYMGLLFSDWIPILGAIRENIELMKKGLEDFQKKKWERTGWIIP